MAGNAHHGEEDWEAVDCSEEGLGRDDAVNETCEKFSREDSVFFD